LSSPVRPAWAKMPFWIVSFRVARSVSATTRAPRPGETDGVDYFFLTPEQFREGIANQFFLEHAQYGSNSYGTPRDKVNALRAQGIDVILKIEVQGAKNVRQMEPDAVMVFLAPPSWEELAYRLKNRRTETEEKIKARLAIARDELACIPDYDYLIVNDDLDQAVETLCAVVTAERCRIRL
jgi:guanylate kinase